mgnify:CR=1 FL=1
MGTRIRQLRKLHQLTQAQLGEMCNASKSAVSQWESDQTLPTLANILSLHEQLKFSLDWLLTGEGDDPNSRSEDRALKLIYSGLDQRGARRRLARGPVRGDLFREKPLAISHGSIDWLHDRRLRLGAHATDRNGQQRASNRQDIRRAHARRGHFPADFSIRRWVRRPTTRPAIDEARWREIRPPAKK